MYMDKYEKHDSVVIVKSSTRSSLNEDETVTNMFPFQTEESRM